VIQTDLTRTIAAGIEYTDSSTGVFDRRKETLVCLHGIGGDDASFLDQSINLPDYRVLSWNMPGYAHSHSLQENTFPNLAEALHRLLTELGTGPVHLVGQSIGGMVAQEYACHHSDNVKSLTLVATTSAFGGRDDSFKQAFLAARLKPLDEGKSMQELAEETVPAITAKSVSQRAVDAAVQSMAAVPVKTYTDILKCLVTFDRRAEFAQIQCPVCMKFRTLVIWLTWRSTKNSMRSSTNLLTRTFHS